jgi:hypothetical protein
MNAFQIISPDQPTRVEQNGFRLPVMRGTMERRILVNFRCDPNVLEKVLPPPFRPRLVHGFGMAGICLIRLRNVRPAGLPAAMGFTSENAAHRIAVEWNENDTHYEGVFIPRRDSNSILNCLAGGRLFPGVHHEAVFKKWETDTRVKVEMNSNDKTTFIRVNARLADELPRTSVFKSLEEASNFFLGGMLGWSLCPTTGEFEGMELRCDSWHLQPLAVEHVESSLFDDASIFPKGAAEFDSAFLMRDIEHTWHDCGRLFVAKETV